MSEAMGESRVGSRFGPYYLKRLLGRGGAGDVYVAEDTVKDRVVALKLFSDDLSHDPQFRQRLRREVRVASSLLEPHVVPIHDYGDIDGRCYLDMRFIDGTDLGTVLKRDGPLTPAPSVAIVRGIAAALDEAHAAGIMHGDVKPENILIARDDYFYLADFGIVSAIGDERRLAQLGTNVKTWNYMAPERFTGREVTYRADIYSLACVLYECLTGSPPFRTDSVERLIRALLIEPVPQPSWLSPRVPSAFDAVIARGMAKDPEDRYASAGDLAMAAFHALPADEQYRASGISVHSPSDAPSVAAGPGPREKVLSLHDDAQFTVYPPDVVRPCEETPLLAFAHLAELPLGADPRDDPIRQVERRARAVLDDRIDVYTPTRLYSPVPLPENAEITFELDLPEFEVKNPIRKFMWINAVHMEEFRVSALADKHGARSRGRLLIFHGFIQLAEVPIAIKVDAEAPQRAALTATPAAGKPYRKIFPSYSHLDTPVVMQFEKYVESLGDRYLRDVRELRAGERWSERLSELIREADVFQLFWSTNAMKSDYVTQEWSYALSLGKSEFIRPTYWEEPMPRAQGLPPDDLGEIHFHPIGKTVSDTGQGAEPVVGPPDLIEWARQSVPLDHEQQRELLLRLQPLCLSSDPDEKQRARSILESLKKRDDLYADIDRALTQIADADRDESPRASITIAAARGPAVQAVPPLAPRAYSPMDHVVRAAPPAYRIQRAQPIPPTYGSASEPWARSTYGGGSQPMANSPPHPAPRRGHRYTGVLVTVAVVITLLLVTIVVVFLLH